MSHPAISDGAVTQEYYLTSYLPTPQAITNFNSCVQFTTDEASEYARMAGGMIARNYFPYQDWNVYWVPSADQR